jgi:hypothetical protein
VEDLSLLNHKVNFAGTSKVTPCFESFLQNIVSSYSRQSRTREEYWTEYQWVDFEDEQDIVLLQASISIFQTESP